MTNTQMRSSNIVVKFLSNELGDFDDETIVLIPRSTVSSEIVKLQNMFSRTKKNNQKLMLLIDSFHSQSKENISKRRFIKMNVKTVNECFSDIVVPVYIDE